MALTPLRYARLEAELTQFDVARKTGIPTGRISMLERGLLVPSDSEIRALARVLSVPLERLCGDAWQAAPQGS